MFPLRLRSPCRRIVTVAAVCAIGMLSAGGASAQTVTRNADGTISVSASELPLGQVLRAVGSVSPFEKLAIQPAAEARPVTVSVVNVSVEEALTVILRTAEVHYVMAGPARLVVGDGVVLAGAERNESRGAVRSPGEQTREDREITEQARPSEPDPPRDRAPQQTATDLERVLVSPPGVPASQAGYAVLPGENGAARVVPLPIGAARASGPALPGLGADPASKPAAPLPSWIPVPPELQALIGVPVRKSSQPKK